MWVKLPSGKIEMVHGSIAITHDVRDPRGTLKNKSCALSFRAGISNSIYMTLFPEVLGTILFETIRRSHFEDYRTVSVLNVAGANEIDEANCGGFPGRSDLIWQ